MAEDDAQLLPYRSTEEAEKELVDAGTSSADRASAESLDADYNLKNAYVARETQRGVLREKAYHHAVAVCLGLSFYLFFMALMIVSDRSGSVSSQAQVAIFATPIISIAAITIFIIRGVFSGFSEKSFSEDASAVAQLSGRSDQSS